MKELSALIITYNEEENIKDALESVKWADEIVVVDSGSSDKTVQICRRYTDRVFYNKWPGYVKQKNFALRKASKNWVLFIDADERVSPPLEEEIKETLKSPSARAYSIPRRTFYLGKWIKHSGWYPDRKLRLFEKNSAYWEGINIHEKVKVKGKVKKLNNDLLHYSYKNISEHINTMNTFTDISAGEYLEKNKGNFADMILRPVWTFFKKFFLKQGFRDKKAGFIIAVSSAYYVFLKYAKVYELKLKRKKKN